MAVLRLTNDIFYIPLSLSLVPHSAAARLDTQGSIGIWLLRIPGILNFWNLPLAVLFQPRM